MKDSASEFLPRDYTGLQFLQEEFDRYQQKGFPERGPHFFCLELNGEAGELANLEKKDWKGKEIPPAQFADEAADVFISLLNYCNARGIDLAGAVQIKMEKIEANRLQK